MLSVLPIITPPFVIGLAVILPFGRAGAATQFVSWLARRAGQPRRLVRADGGVRPDLVLIGVPFRLQLFC